MRTLPILLGFIVTLAPWGAHAQESPGEMTDAALAAVQLALADAGVDPDDSGTFFDSTVMAGGTLGPDVVAFREAVTMKINARAVARSEVIACSGPSLERRIECRFTDPRVVYLVNVSPPRHSSNALLVDVGISGATPRGQVFHEVRAVLVNRLDDGSWRAERIVTMTAN